MSLVFINHPLETFTPTSSGALATIIWECCREAKSEGHAPAVITRSSREPIYPWPKTVLLEYPRLPSGGFGETILKAQRKLTGWNHLRHKAYAVRVAEAIRSVADKDDPLVLINDPEMTIYLRKQFPQRRIIHWFENQQDARPRVKRDFAACATAVCGVSDFTADWIRGYYALEYVPTVYNGVDSRQFTPAPAEPAGPVFINFVGRTGIEKAPDLLLKAALKLAESTSDFGVQLVGSNHWDRFEMDDYQRELAAMVDQLTAKGIEARRPGHVGRADLPDQFRRAHIHVVPSRWDEPFGLTTVEGMASGLATVASRTGGTPEVVGDAGRLFERDSVEELTEHLRELVLNASVRRDLAARARERAKEFSWKRTWTSLKQLAEI